MRLDYMRMIRMPNTDGSASPYAVVSDGHRYPFIPRGPDHDQQTTVRSFMANLCTRELDNGTYLGF